MMRACDVGSRRRLASPRWVRHVSRRAPNGAKSASTRRKTLEYRDLTRHVTLVMYHEMGCASIRPPAVPNDSRTLDGGLCTMRVSNPREDGGNTDGFVSPPRTKLTTPPRTDLYGKHALSRVYGVCLFRAPPG